MTEISDERLAEFEQMINGPHASPMIQQFQQLLEAYKEQICINNQATDLISKRSLELAQKDVKIMKIKESFKKKLEHAMEFYEKKEDKNCYMAGYSSGEIDLINEFLEELEE